MPEFILTLLMMYLSVTTPISQEIKVSEQVYAPDTGSIIITVPLPTAPAEPETVTEPITDTDITQPSAPSEAVLDYVQELKNLGFIKADSSDEYLNTRNGVLRFQSSHNLMVDGIFGPISTASLKKRLKETSFQYTDTVTSPPVKGKWILINKSKRILTLYEGSLVSKKYPIAVGKSPLLTPEGKFKIALKIVNPYWGGAGIHEPIQGGLPENPLGYRWMGLNIGKGGDYGVHGNNSPYSIGTDASLGCVRMINSDVEELFNIVAVGTPIWITIDDGLAGMEITQKEYID